MREKKELGRGIERRIRKAKNRRREDWLTQENLCCTLDMYVSGCFLLSVFLSVTFCYFILSFLQCVFLSFRLFVSFVLSAYLSFFLPYFILFLSDFSSRVTLFNNRQGSAAMTSPFWWLATLWCSLLLKCWNHITWGLCPLQLITLLGGCVPYN